MFKFDQFIERKTTEDGKIIYFPKGIFGKGYIIPDQEMFQKLSNAIKRMVSVYLLFGLILGVIVTPLLLDKFFPLSDGYQSILIISFIFFISSGVFAWEMKQINGKYLDGLEVSTEKTTLSEIMNRKITSLSWFYLSFIFLGMIWILHTGYMIVFDPVYGLFGIIYLIIMVPLFGFVCYLVYLKFRSYFHL